jgi:hypothetical protein
MNQDDIPPYGTITASQARLLRKQLKPAKKKKPIEKSDHTKKLAKVDKYFSLMFRASEADENGRVTCATCGKDMNWKEKDGSCHTSHFESRGFNNTRFNLKNVAIGCRKCNYYLEGNKEKLKAYLIGRYGKEEIQRIETLSRINRSINDTELEAMAESFKKEFEKTVKQKGLIV